MEAEHIEESAAGVWYRRGSLAIFIDRAASITSSVKSSKKVGNLTLLLINSSAGVQVTAKLTR